MTNTEKAWKWARKAVRPFGSTTVGSGLKKLTDFAEKYLYGKQVPTWKEVEEAADLTLTPFVQVTTFRVKDGYKEVAHFSFQRCTLQGRTVSFALTKSGEVHKARHKKGECPFRRYPQTEGNNAV